MYFTVVGVFLQAATSLVVAVFCEFFAVQCTLAGLSATPIAITSRRDVSSKYLISHVTQDVRWKQMLVDRRVACAVSSDA